MTPLPHVQHTEHTQSPSTHKGMLAALQAGCSKQRSRSRMSQQLLLQGSECPGMPYGVPQLPRRVNSPARCKTALQVHCEGLPVISSFVQELAKRSACCQARLAPVMPAETAQ